MGLRDQHLRYREIDEATDKMVRAGLVLPDGIFLADHLGLSDQEGRRLAEEMHGGLVAHER